MLIGTNSPFSYSYLSAVFSLANRSLVSPTNSAIITATIPESITASNAPAPPNLIGVDNERYKIVEVDKANYRAMAEFVEDVGKVNMEYSNIYRLMQLVIKEQTNKVGLFCTHTDESYVPTDGTESEPESGGILDVSKSLEDALRERGCEVVRKDTIHEPHDAGAYRRSRQTAVGIIEEMQPTILADIHRDAVPPEVYEEEIDGEKVSKVRMVIGASPSTVIKHNAILNIFFAPAWSPLDVLSATNFAIVGGSPAVESISKNV